MTSTSHSVRIEPRVGRDGLPHDDPEGQDKSVTELEYDRAVERSLPVFIFIADDQHPAPFATVETGAGAEKLQAFKERLRKNHVVKTFRSAEELRSEIIQALIPYREGDAEKLHYIAEIPPPPAPWIAHWYSLLGNRPLIGRRDELNLLTDWVARPSSSLYSARLLALVAIGGMGKSALAWTWWNDIAPNEMKPLAGRMWWSFYESDARLENFTTRALSYLTGHPRAVTAQIPVRDREDQLIGILDREPHLVVLDGLERELVAYASMDASHLSDDDLDAKTAHHIALRAGLPATAAQSFVGEAKLRQTIDPRTGQFLRRLTQVRVARVLVTTRLFPLELQAFNGSRCQARSQCSCPVFVMMTRWRCGDPPGSAARGTRWCRSSGASTVTRCWSRRWPARLRVTAGVPATLRSGRSDTPISTHSRYH